MNDVNYKRAQDIKFRLGELSEEIPRVERLLSSLTQDNPVGIMGIRFTLPKQAIQGQLTALQNQLEAERTALQTEFDNL